jgi:hypothetical protein
LSKSKKFKGKKEVFLTKGFIEKNSIKLKAVDTGFKERGYQEFEGIPILSILKHYSKKGIEEVTFIAKNQYVTFEEKDDMEKKTLIIAYKAQGKVISNGKKFMA